MNSDRRPHAFLLGGLLLLVALPGCGPGAAGTAASSAASEPPPPATDAAGTLAETTPEPAPPGEGEPIVDDPMPPPLPVEPPATARCGEPGVRALVAAPPIALDCTGEPPDCEGRIPIHIENCGPGALELQFIDVVFPAGGVMTMDFAPGTMLREGETTDRDGLVKLEGDYRVEVHAAERDGTAVDLGPVAVAVSNPARDAAREACTACRGDWGRHGMTGREGCICATSDGGSECRDGAECEGECVFERFEEVSPGMGVPVGRCSELEVLFGCNPLLRDGVAAEPPQPLPGRSPRICVD